MEIGDSIRYKSQVVYHDKDGKLILTDKKIVQFSKVKQIKSNFILLENNTLIIPKDIIKCEKKLEDVVVKGDGYYYTLDGKMLQMPTFINWDNDYEQFKKINRSNLEHGAKLHLLAHENIPWEEIKL